MLDNFNNIWVMLLCIILLLFIIKKIYNLNKPFDEKRFIEQYVNQQKLQNNFSFKAIPHTLPKLASYYVGLN
jgi:hypothetical protein